MRIKEWVAENIGYRFFGCFYNIFNKPLFNFIELKIPKDFLDKNISDLGCGDGINTLRIRRMFKAKEVIGYDNNDYLLKRAQKKGFKIEKIDLNKEIPRGEMAVFTFSLHHLKDKEKALRKVITSFDYLFLCEPIKDFYHAFLDAGEPLKKQEWIRLFDNVLKRYLLYQYRNNLIVFYKRKNGIIKR